MSSSTASSRDNVVDIESVGRRGGGTPAAASGIARGLGRTVTSSSSAAARGGIDLARTFGGAVGSVAGATVETATAGVRAATRRLTEEPSGALDDWGRDPVLVRNVMMLAQLRWDVTTGGDQHLPKRRGALIVVNSPRFAFAPLFAAFAISEAVDRPVRFVGRADDDLVGAAARRLGGLLDHPDEVAGALRDDQLVVLGAQDTGLLTRRREVGVVDHSIVGAALATGTKVFPAATSSGPSRRARVEIGRAAGAPPHRRGPLAELELADRIRHDIAELLDELGDIATGTPLDWLPIPGLGGR